MPHPRICSRHTGLTIPCKSQNGACLPVHRCIASSRFAVLHHCFLEHTAALTMYENALRKSTAGGLSANVADGDDSNSFGEVDVEEHTRLAQVIASVWLVPAPTHCLGRLQCRWTFVARCDI